MIRRIVKRLEYEPNPYVAWNAFVDLVAMESPDDLSEIQRHAHFVFTYYSEVENGGHLQYFENQSIQHSDATAQALHALDGLEAIGAIEHRAVLAQAIDRWTATSRRRIGSVEEYAQWHSKGNSMIWTRRIRNASLKSRSAWNATLIPTSRSSSNLLERGASTPLFSHRKWTFGGTLP